MPTYSHRDHRVFRASYRLVAGVTGVSIGLVAIGVAAPWPVVGGLAVLGMAVLGAIALLRSGAIVEGYVADLRRVGDGDSASGLLRVEVESRVELERPVFVVGHRSPSVRPPLAATPRGRVPLGHAGESP